MSSASAPPQHSTKQAPDTDEQSNGELSLMGHSLFSGSLFQASERKESTDEIYGQWAKAYDQDMETLKFDSLATMPLKIDEYLPRQTKPKICEQTDNAVLNLDKLCIDKGDEPEVTDPKILDVGCGTGLLGQLLRDKKGADRNKPESKLVIDGMDLTQGMLDILQKERGDIYNSVQQQDITATPWPFKDDAYDVTVCNGVLVYVKDNVDECLDEFVRVTKPGGYCLLMLRQDCLHTFSQKIYQLLTDRKWRLAEITDTRFNFKKQEGNKQRGYVPYNHHIFQVL